MQDFYSISEGQIFLNATDWFEKRLLANFEEPTGDSVVRALKEKFQELRKQIRDLKEEFEKEDEIMELAGKASRTRAYFLEAKAIGDYADIFPDLIILEDKLRERMQEVLMRKEEIVQEMSELKSPKDWKEATQNLIQLQKEFKKLPVVPDLKDTELAKRVEEEFEAFFEQKQTHYNLFEQELLDNLAKKIELCEAVEERQDSSDWRKTTDELKAITDKWMDIGMIPRHRSEELWLRFNAAKDLFYKRKSDFYKELIENFEENLKLKEELITKAESLQDSTDWSKTSEEMKSLLDEWKSIGNVGKEKSDEVWERFNKARDLFFNRKKEHFSKLKLVLEDNLAKKRIIVERARELNNSKDLEGAFKEYNQLFDEWKQTHPAPRKEANQLWDEFYNLRKEFYDKRNEHRSGMLEENLEAIKNKIGKNASYLRKLQKELQIEYDVVNDFRERIENLAPSVNAFESRERYEKIVEEAESKANLLQRKVDELEKKIKEDQREKGGIIYQLKRRKGRGGNDVSTEENGKEMKEQRVSGDRKRHDRNDKIRDKKNSPRVETQTLLGAKLQGLNFDNLNE